MLNLEEIDNTIVELENSATTFDTCIKLASLYIVREKINERDLTSNFNISGGNTDKVTNELDDILPQYNKYREIKREYQLGHVTEQAVLHELEFVCTEIEEFINTLYSSTDIPQERHIMEGTLSKLYKQYL